MNPRNSLPAVKKSFSDSKIRVQVSLNLEKRYWDAIREVAKVGFQRADGKKLAVSRAIETLIVAALQRVADPGHAWSQADVDEAGLSIVHASWIRHHEEED